MKDYILDEEEKKLLKEIENGEWQSVENLEEEKARLVESAKYSKFLKEKKQVSIRFSVEDLIAIKSKAKQIGIGYQNLIQLLVHNYVNNKTTLTLGDSEQ